MKEDVSTKLDLSVHQLTLTFATKRHIYVYIGPLLPIPQIADKLTTLYIDSQWQVQGRATWARAAKL